MKTAFLLVDTATASKGETIPIIIKTLCMRIECRLKKTIRKTKKRTDRKILRKSDFDTEQKIFSFMQKLSFKKIS